MSAPRTVGRFEVVEALGDGSFGSLLEGRDGNDGQAVQIQLCTLDDPELRRRFHAEATEVAKLRHPHVVEVRGVGFEGEVPYLVEESIPRHLGQILEQRPPWSAGEKLALLQQVARGLAYGHSRGLQHHELRPDQIKLANVEGRHVAKVAGFGVARLANSESRTARKGVTLETAVYLPPEQIRGGEVDHRVDLFALGVVAYELLTYERPFRGQNLSALVYQILYKEPQAMVAAWPDCPGSLEQILGRCLAKKPEDRYDSVEAMLADIETFLRQAHGRWAGLEKPYQAMSSVTRDVSDTEVTRSQLARTAEGLGPRGSDGAATVRLQVDPGAVEDRIEDFEPGLEATQSLPALGDEAPSEPSAAADEPKRPGESTITLPSPPEAIAPPELGGPALQPSSSEPSSSEPSSAAPPLPVESPTASAGSPATTEGPPVKKKGVDTRPVGRKTVRLDAIPVVTPNRPVPPSPPPPATPPPPQASSTPRAESGDELPTVLSSQPLAAMAEEPEEPTLVTSDELPTVLSSQPLAGTAEEPEEPTLVTSDELPTVLSSQPLAGMAEEPEEPTLVTSDELPTVLSSQPLAGMAEEPEEPTLVTSDELPTVLSSQPLAGMAEEPEEPTLVTSSDELPTLPSTRPPAPTAGGETLSEPTLVVPIVADSGTEAPAAAHGVDSGVAGGAGEPEPTLVVPVGLPESTPASPTATSPTSGALAPPTPAMPSPEMSPSALPPPAMPAPATPPSAVPPPSVGAPVAAPTPAPLSPASPSPAPPSPAPPSPAMPTPPPSSPEPISTVGSAGVPSPVAFEPAVPPQDAGGVVLTQGPSAPQPGPPARKGPGKGLWIALAGVALLGMLVVAGLAWWWFVGRGADEAPDDSGTTVTTPTPPPPVATDTPLGQVVVLAAPWGRLVEITDSAGFVQDLPSDPFTPLSLTLPPGRYRITLQYGDDPGLPAGGEAEAGGDSATAPEPDTDEVSTGEGSESETVASGEPTVCEVEVRLDTVARCQVQFEAPSATDYFKEAGWWQ